jgi:hypothetical protein
LELIQLEIGAIQASLVTSEGCSNRSHVIQIFADALEELWLPVVAPEPRIPIPVINILVWLAAIAIIRTTSL